MFAEGSLPERHTLVLEKRHIFCEVFAEGSLPERNSLVLKSHIFGKFGLKWVAVARFGLKMGGNESHEVQDHF